MNILRSIVAVIVGIALMSIIINVVESMLVTSLAGRALYTMGDYFAVRNRPGILAAKVIYTTLGGLLGGYVTAKIARGEEIRSAASAAALQTIVLVWDFTAGAYAWGTPVWMRILLVAISGPAMLAGAAIRARAAQLAATDVESGTTT